jgi:hypothetical protein
MCFVRISEQTAITFLYSINRLVFITEMESVYCAVRTSSSYIKEMHFVFKRVKPFGNTHSSAARPELQKAVVVIEAYLAVNSHCTV